LNNGFSGSAFLRLVSGLALTAGGWAVATANVALWVPYASVFQLFWFATADSHLKMFASRLLNFEHNRKTPNR
jgi:hypothetical protein